MMFIDYRPGFFASLGFPTKFYQLDLRIFSTVLLTN